MCENAGKTIDMMAFQYSR